MTSSLNFCAQCLKHRESGGITTANTVCALYQQNMGWFERVTLVALSDGCKQVISPLKQILFCFVRCVSFLKVSKLI